MLVTLADQCDHKLMQYREEEKIEIRDLKQEKKTLNDYIMKLNNDKQSLNIQVERVEILFCFFLILFFVVVI
jgi:hypothetical protein